MKNKSLLVILIAVLISGSALGCLGGCPLTSLIARGPTSTPIPTRTPKPTFTPTPKATDTPIPTNTPEVPTPTDTPPPPPPTSVPTPTPISQPEATVATEAMNVRSGPGVNYGQIGQVKEGEKLKVVGRTEASDWLKIVTSDGQEGWVLAELVTVNTDLGAVAVAQAPPPPTPKPKPPTPTPEPPPPTSPPQPTAIPRSPYQYRVGRVGCTPNCGSTGIKGIVYDANNNYVPGLQIQVAADGWCCGWAETNSYEPYKILLGPGARPGHWYITVYSHDKSTQLSEMAEANTVVEPCAPDSGGCQWVEVDFVINK